MRSNFRAIISISVFIITISSISRWSYLPFNNTTMWWIIYAILIFLLIKSKLYVFDKLNEKNLLLFKLFFLWNLVCIVRGFFVAQDYWEWKYLVNTIMIMMIPLVIYTATNTFMMQKIIGLWLRYTLPAFIILMPFIYVDAMGRYLIPISFILLFFPILPYKWKMISLAAAAFVFFVDISARSNVLKFATPICFSFLYYFNRNISDKIISIGRYVFIISPIMLFFLGVTNTFNVFKMSDYIKGDYEIRTHEGNSDGVGDLRTDTRTFLYEESIISAFKHNYVWLGRTPAKGYESPHFGPQIDKENKTKKKERHRSEVSVLNVFTWTGVLGVVLYLLVFIKATHLAVNKSNNLMMKIIGLYVAFRWFYAWVEDFSDFDLSTFFLWVCIGMCFSESFRSHTDKEMKYWLHGIFNKNFRIDYIKSQLYKKSNNFKKLNTLTK